MERKAKSLKPEQILFLGFLAISILLLVADFFRNPVQGFTGYRALIIGLLVLMVVLAAWTFRGGLRAPAAVYLGLVFAAFVYVAAELNGVHSVTIDMFILLIFMAVPLLGWGTALGVTVASLVVLWVLAFLPIPVALPPAPVQARNLTLVFVGVFLLVWWYSRELRRVADRLRQNNLMLEARVEQRTKQVLVSENLATVGRLSAALAHELNTPLGAVTSAHSSADEVLSGSLLSTFRSLASLKPDRRAFVEVLVERILSTPHPALLPTSSQVRDQKKKLMQWGEDGGLPVPECVALVDVVMDMPLTRDEFLTLGRDEDWRTAIQVLDATQNLSRSVEVIGRGAQKMAQVVRSFQTLSRQDTDSEPGPVDPKEEFESTLSLLQSRIPTSVEVIREFDTSVVVQARPDRLSQVLINLMTNALQAMDSKGTLTLVIGRQAEQAVLVVSDNGPGVPPDLREKIFEPFFTTKAPGEGNGLGLELSRRICEEEGGSLTLETEVGQTRFVVRLPLGE